MQKDIQHRWGLGGGLPPLSLLHIRSSLISFLCLSWGPRSKGCRSPNCSDLLKRMHLPWICGVNDCSGNVEPRKDEWTISCELITLSVRRGLSTDAHQSPEMRLTASPHPILRRLSQCPQFKVEDTGPQRGSGVAQASSEHGFTPQSF